METIHNEFRSEQINFLLPRIELVRDKFVYKKLTYESIVEIKVKNGYLINNRWLLRIISICAIYLTTHFILYGLAISGGILQMNSAQWFNRGSIIAIWGPVLLIIGAIIAFIQTFIKAVIFIIRTNNTKHTLRIQNLENDKTIEELLIFLRKKNLLITD